MSMTVFVFHQKVAEAKAKKAAIEKNPIVEFNYPFSKDNPKSMQWVSDQRLVRLISANHKYYLGLEITDHNRFKRFLRKKAYNFRIVEFQPESMP